MKLLHIDSSSRHTRSHTRRLTRLFVERWTHSHPGTTVVYRDLAISPAPNVNEGWIEAAFRSEEQRTPAMHEALGVSNLLLDEVEWADILVWGVPMYNFGPPAAFKAYIDQIVRINRTFTFDPGNPEEPIRPFCRTNVSLSSQHGAMAGSDRGSPTRR